VATPPLGREGHDASCAGRVAVGNAPRVTRGQAVPDERGAWTIDSTISDDPARESTAVRGDAEKAAGAVRADATGARGARDHHTVLPRDARDGRAGEPVARHRATPGSGPRTAAEGLAVGAAPTAVALSGVTIRRSTSPPATFRQPNAC